MNPNSPSFLPGPVTSPGTYLPPNGSASQLPTPPASPTSTVDNSEVDELTKRNTAWKYEGYGSLSQWMASDDDFFIIRRFGTVNARVILWMQQEISQKESMLEKLHSRMEQTTEKTTGIEGQNDSFEWDKTNLPERHNLMRDLAALTLHYSVSSNEHRQKLTLIRQVCQCLLQDSCPSGCREATSS